VPKLASSTLEEPARGLVCHDAIDTMLRNAEENVVRIARLRCETEIARLG
jgi:hypothetical protein